MRGQNWRCFRLRRGARSTTSSCARFTPKPCRLVPLEVGRGVTTGCCAPDIGGGSGSCSGSCGTRTRQTEGVEKAATLVGETRERVNAVRPAAQTSGGRRTPGSRGTGAGRPSVTGANVRYRIRRCVCIHAWLWLDFRHVGNGLHTSKERLIFIPFPDPDFTLGVLLKTVGELFS